MLVSDESQKPIVANAARLLSDSKLLHEHKRYGSAFALAVLATEELGKVILNYWGNPDPPAKRLTAHLRKQGAVASVMVAKYMIAELGDQLPIAGPITDELVEKVGRAIWDSKSGRFRLSVHLGAVDKVKQLSLYHDDWAADAGFYDSEFTAEDAEQFYDMCREAVRAIGDERMMRVGKAIYVSAHPSVAMAFKS